MFIHIHCLGNKMKCYKHLVAQLVAIGCVMKLWHSMPWNKTFFFYLLGLIPLPLNPFHTECHCFFSWTSLVALPWSCCNQQLFFTNLEHTKCSSVSTKDVDNFSRRWGGFQEVKFHCKDPKQTSKLQQGCWSSCFFLKSMVWHILTHLTGESSSIEMKSCLANPTFLDTSLFPVAENMIEQWKACAFKEHVKHTK